MTGCNGGDSSSDTEAATFSLAVSDAPVDDANKVVLAFEDVVLIPFDPETGDKTGDAIIMNVSEDGALRQVDLMQYQGSNAETIIRRANYRTWRLCDVLVRKRWQTAKRHNTFLRRKN
ncbi:DUF4382 domain-containing protein [Vibrio sp. M60_M31a]